MRVTHIITRLVVGGAQENTITTVLGLRDKADVQVDIISGPTAGREGSLESCLSVDTGLLEIEPSLVRPVHPWFDALATTRLTAMLRKRRPDIVHTHSGKAGVLGRIAAHRAGVPLIIHHIHGPSFGNFQGSVANFVFRFAERYAARYTTHFICSADAMSRLYLAAGIGRPDMYTRVFSGFKLEPFLSATNDLEFRKSLQINPNEFVVGCVSRISPLKGHHDLLIAAKALLPRCPSARLLLIGDGPIRPEIETEARSLGIHNRIVFAGLVPPAEVHRYVGIMDCLVHLSYREAVSRALPQALAAGKPVVTYDFDGADEVCQDGKSGFIVRTGHTGIVAERLLQLASDKSLRDSFGQMGRAFVAENFPARKMIDAQYELYAALLRKRRIP